MVLAAAWIVLHLFDAPSIEEREPLPRTIERPRVRIGAASKWTPDDYRALAAAAAQIVARPEDLLLVLYSESRLDPHAAARGSDGFPIAVGLNQITGVNAHAMGITEAERVSLLNLGVTDQLPYVVRSFRAATGGPHVFGDAGALYQANAAPGTLSQGSGDEVVLYTAAKNPTEYNANKGLDRNNDGRITVGDLRSLLAMLAKTSGYQTALAELAAAVPGTQAPNVGGADLPMPKPIETNGGGLDGPAVAGSASSSGGAGVLLAGVALGGGLLLWRLAK